MSILWLFKITEAIFFHHDLICLAFRLFLLLHQFLNVRKSNQYHSFYLNSWNGTCNLWNFVKLISLQNYKLVDKNIKSWQCLCNIQCNISKCKLCPIFAKNDTTSPKQTDVNKTNLSIENFKTKRKRCLTDQNCVLTWCKKEMVLLISTYMSLQFRTRWKFFFFRNPKTVFFRMLISKTNKSTAGRNQKCKKVKVKAKNPRAKNSTRKTQLIFITIDIQT